MDSAGVLSLLEQLDDEIDDLEDSLSPVLITAISSTASKVPLLDKAKLYILMTYAIESILFSYLRLNGVNAREHPVFRELNRVKQYFDKIKNAEALISKRGNMNLDKQAAGRFIRAGLAGNDKYDLEHAERQAKEKARLHIRLDKVTSGIKPSDNELTKATPIKTPHTSDDSSSDSEDVSPQSMTETEGSSKKRKVSALRSSEEAPESEKTRKKKVKKGRE